MGGSMGQAVGEAFVRGIENAIRHHCPYVIFTASGGARMQEGILSLMQMPRSTVAIQMLHDAGLPYLVVLTDPTSGGVMAAYAMRGAAAHAMARFHQTYDLVLCPAVPNPPPAADAPVADPVEALWTQWAPWTFAFNLTRQPAISVPMGFGASGMPRSVQLAGALYRDDLVLRAARMLELAQPFGMPEL